MDRRVCWGWPYGAYPKIDLAYLFVLLPAAGDAAAWDCESAFETNRVRGQVYNSHVFLFLLGDRRLPYEPTGRPPNAAPLAREEAAFASLFLEPPTNPNSRCCQVCAAAWILA